MRYWLQDGVVSTEAVSGGAVIDIESVEEKEQLCAHEPAFAGAVRAALEQRNSSLEVLDNAVFAAMRLPDGEEGSGLFLWVESRRLIVLARGADRLRAATRALLTKSARKLTLPMCAQRILGALAQYEAPMMEEIEDEISILEEQVLSGGELKAFTRDMSPPRKRLMRLHSYYERLGDVAEVLAQNENDIFPQGELAPFRHLLGAMGRLSDNTKLLREYAMQVQEIYQSQVDIQQNNIMRVLTVITTIVLPLSLITGWYGMNFSGMRELEWEYGYAMVIVVSALVVGLTIWYFRRKKYM